MSDYVRIIRDGRGGRHYECHIPKTLYEQSNPKEEGKGYQHNERSNGPSKPNKVIQKNKVNPIVEPNQNPNFGMKNRFPYSRP